LLPEYHLTNWVPKEPGFLECCDEWELYLKKYQALAKELSICIVPGTIVERHQDAETEEERLLNVAYFIGKEGDILGKYVKKNLWYDSFLKPFPLSILPNAVLNRICLKGIPNAITSPLRPTMTIPFSIPPSDVSAC
jgi:hypothetical protein